MPRRAIYSPLSVGDYGIVGERDISLSDSLVGRPGERGNQNVIMHPPGRISGASDRDGVDARWRQSPGESQTLPKITVRRVDLD